MDNKCRIGQAKQAFMNMRNVLCARNLELRVRKRLSKCYIWSCNSMDASQGQKGKILTKSLRRQKCGYGVR